MSELAIPDVLASLDSLARAGGVTGTSLEIHDPDLSFDRYEALGRMLGRIRNATAFWIGDWLIFGEATYGEEMAQAAEVVGRTESTLQNFAWVCRHVPPARRRPRLSFTHHQYVAKFEAREQVAWLDEAERHGWASRDLLQAIREREILGAQNDPEACAALVRRFADKLAERLGVLRETGSVTITARVGDVVYEERSS
jgi:hypothetical protein